MTVRRTGNDPSKSKKLSRKVSPWRQWTRKLQQNPTYQVLIAVIVIGLSVLFATYGGGSKATKSSAAFNSPIVTNRTEAAPDVYEVVDVPGRGKGMVARRNIKQGELILTDDPILRYEPDPQEDPIEYVWTQMANLTWEQANEIQSLSYPPATPPRGVPLAIVMTNGYVAGPSMALFTKAARMNHACASAMNVAHNWRETDEKLYMHALKDIKKGEELFTSYIDSKEPREARMKALKDDYHFECDCPVCSLPEHLSVQSDVKLSNLKELFERLKGWNDDSIDGKETIAIVNQIWDLSLELDYVNELGEIAAIASMVSSAHSDLDAARKWNKLAAKWMGIAFGKDSLQAQMSKVWAQDPETHPTYAKKEAMLVGGPIAVAMKTLE
ncbi:hypothetical protein FRB90_002213 [Tulasnella sp. 427]|nr:hypothetical protein FRB90_002213 [Tulasnella sp. 427]